MPVQRKPLLRQPFQQRAAPKLNLGELGTMPPASTGPTMGRGLGGLAGGLGQAAGGGALPSYKKGGKVKKTGVAKLHKGERVLTAKQAKTSTAKGRAVKTRPMTRSR
jgi:hypothetical protein